MEEKITKKDEDFIQKLLMIDEEIYKIYDKLSDLEFNNLLNTKEYQELLVRLKDLIVIEDSIYNLEKFDKERIKKLLNYLFNEEKFNKMDVKSLIARRISCELNNQYSNFAIDEKAKLVSSISNDLQNITIFFANEYIKNQDFSKYKKEIIRSMKYFNVFFDKRLERNMVDSNFVIPDNIYISSNLFAEYLKVSDTELDDIKICFLNNIVLFQANFIATCPDSAFSNFDTYLNLIFSKCSLKAALILFPNYITDKFYDSILSLENNKNSKAFMYLKNSFEEMNDDKKKIITVSFNRNRN